MSSKWHKPYSDQDTLRIRRELEKSSFLHEKKCDNTHYLVRRRIFSILFILFVL